MTLDARLLEILACPRDKGPLLYFADEDSLYNPRLRLRYRVDDGIPVMLTDEAASIEDGEHERLTAKAEADGIAPTFVQPAAGDGGADDAGAVDGGAGDEGTGGGEATAGAETAGRGH